MTMDEVNDLFPLMKYKSWRSTRASKGLSTSGGISVPPSRAPSVKGEKDLSVPTVEIIEHVDSGTSSQSLCSQSQRYFVNPDTQSYTSLPAGHSRSLSKESSQTEAHPRVSFSLEQHTLHEAYTDSTKAITSICEEKADNQPQLSREPSQASFKSARSVLATSFAAREHNPEQCERAAEGFEEEEEDYSEPIQHATTAEHLESSGDTCAVCLDSIEDDDDIRGLKCDHTFHASCIDPWLTTRRACCPLCKADYYIPKPRPEEVTEPERVARPPRRGNRQREQPTDSNFVPFLPTFFMSSRSMTTLQASLSDGRDPELRAQNPQDRGPPSNESNGPAAEPNASEPRHSRGRPIRPSLQRLRNFGRTRTGALRWPNQRHEPAITSEPTPRQLESGQV